MEPDDIKTAIAEAVAEATRLANESNVQRAAEARALVVERLKKGLKGAALIGWTLAMLVVGHTL